MTSGTATISEPLSLDASQPDVSIRTGHLRMGGQSPAGETIGVNSRYVTLSGRPIVPVMGEFHFSRYPRDAWELELRKMKAGGVTVAATYLFWIHHEEEQGVFDFTGQRDVRHFISLCDKVGLKVFARIGPWAHGECRNGGFPDWLLKTSCKPRSNDPAYLALVRIYWQRIAQQLRGLYFQDGGPIIGIQLENELMDAAEHLLTLKELAKELGIIAPLYTCTGWGSVKVPRDEVLPVFGGYPDGFWERTLDDWPGHFRIHYFFSHVRNDSTIGNDLTKASWAGEQPDLDRYPYLTCEVGGGMHVSYHRRIRIEPGDITALALKMIGSGSNMQGYYMYHGGSNPPGKLSTMQESQATGYPNDVPEISYDFQAPLGEFGQVGPAYHGLRVLHQFLADFGSDVAPMPSVLPDRVPQELSNTGDVRCAVRSDGTRGFLFINNYQRREPLPAHEQVQFSIKLADRELIIPEKPVRIKSGVHCVWPIRMPVEDAVIAYATVQPFARMTIDGMPHVVFKATCGVPAEIILESKSVTHVAADHARIITRDGSIRIDSISPGHNDVIPITTAAGKQVRIVILAANQACAAWILRQQDRQWLVIAPGVMLDSQGHSDWIHRPDQAAELMIYPDPHETTINGQAVAPTMSGTFTDYKIDPDRQAPKIHWQRIRAAGPASAVRIGPAGVATAPDVAAFEHAAIWEITVPPDAMTGLHDLRLSIKYTGDCARAYVGKQLITDNYYNGAEWMIGLKSVWPQVAREGLRIEILPLRGDAPIYVPRESHPALTGEQQIAELHSIVALPEQIATLCLR